MYHDQGLPVLKSQGFGEAINITLGLPFIRTSVDHGTALSLAGTGLAKAQFKCRCRFSFYLCSELNFSCWKCSMYQINAPKPRKMKGIKLVNVLVKTSYMINESLPKLYAQSIRVRVIISSKLVQVYAALTSPLIGECDALTVVELDRDLAAGLPERSATSRTI